MLLGVLGPHSQNKRYRASNPSPLTPHPPPVSHSLLYCIKFFWPPSLPSSQFSRKASTPRVNVHQYTKARGTFPCMRSSQTPDLDFSRLQLVMFRHRPQPTCVQSLVSTPLAYHDIIPAFQFYAATRAGFSFISVGYTSQTRCIFNYAPSNPQERWPIDIEEKAKIMHQSLIHGIASIQTEPISARPLIRLYLDSYSKDFPSNLLGDSKESGTIQASWLQLYCCNSLVHVLYTIWRGANRCY